MLFTGLAVAEYRTAPHMQPPWMSLFRVLSPIEVESLPVRERLRGENFSVLPPDGLRRFAGVLLTCAWPFFK